MSAKPKKSAGFSLKPKAFAWTGNRGWRQRTIFPRLKNSFHYRSAHCRRLIIPPRKWRPRSEPIFGVDRQLIRDGTYFVVEAERQIIGCGGWSNACAPFGSDEHRSADDRGQLDPKYDPARLRAFFIHPDWARRGIGRSILLVCRSRRPHRRFPEKFELVATLAGEPLYARCSAIRWWNALKSL